MAGACCDGRFAGSVVEGGEVEGEPVAAVAACMAAERSAYMSVVAGTVTVGRVIGRLNRERSDCA